MADILVIEDDASTLHLLKRTLEPEHAVHGKSDLKSAREALRNRNFDLLLLDVLLPDGDGFDFAEELRKHGRLDDLPLLFITAKSSVADQVLGLSIGADDYIIKPIVPLVLRARVNSKVLKLEKQRLENECIALDPLKLDLAKQRAYIRSETENRELELTSLEFRLLLHFARHEDQVFSRDQLITAIWGDGVHILDRTIDTHICHLRQKIRESTYTLESVYGAGYRLTRTTAGGKP